VLTFATYSPLKVTAAPLTFFGWSEKWETYVGQRQSMPRSCIERALDRFRSRRRRPRPLAPRRALPTTDPKRPKSVVAAAASIRSPGCSLDTGDPLGAALRARLGGHIDTRVRIDDRGDTDVDPARISRAARERRRPACSYRLMMHLNCAVPIKVHFFAKPFALDDSTNSRRVRTSTAAV
jgi:hypothetical protein